MIAASTVVDVASMDIDHTTLWEPFRMFLLMKEVRSSFPVSFVCRIRRYFCSAQKVALRTRALIWQTLSDEVWRCCVCFCRTVCRQLLPGWSRSCCRTVSVSPLGSEASIKHVCVGF